MGNSLHRPVVATFQGDVRRSPFNQAIFTLGRARRQPTDSLARIGRFDRRWMRATDGQETLHASS